MARVIPLGSVTPVIVQLLSPPKLKYFGVLSVKSMTPKSGIEEDALPADELGLFEQPMASAAIMAAPIMKFGMRIKCERCLTPELTHAGPKAAAREAELSAPSGVVCSDLVSRHFAPWDMSSLRSP